jgi:hypothetical protein
MKQYAMSPRRAATTASQSPALFEQPRPKPEFPQSRECHNVRQRSKVNGNRSSRVEDEVIEKGDEFLNEEWAERQMMD